MICFLFILIMDGEKDTLKADAMTEPVCQLVETSICVKEDEGFSDSMRRVDWRWAVQKGYLNKETNTWNEELGGKEAYLRQRNDRMRAR